MASCRTWIAGLALLLAAFGAACGDEEDRDAAVTTRSTPASTSTTSVPTTTTSAPTITTSTTTTITTTTGRPVAGEAVVVSRGDPSRPVVALTFDAGADAGYTADILATLARNDIRASFGITGAWARSHPDLVEAIASAGHQLLNHSDDHPSFTGFSTGTGGLTTAERLEQLARAEEAIAGAAGVGAAPWFRPPYGDVDASVARDVWAGGFRYVVLWTVDSLGWKGAPADAITTRCIDRAEPGAIYLFHVGSGSADALALQPVVDGLRAAGYAFATVADLVHTPVGTGER